MTPNTAPPVVIAGLVPAIHESFDHGVRVGARDNPRIKSGDGHDEGGMFGRTESNQRILTDSRRVAYSILAAIKGQSDRRHP